MLMAHPVLLRNLTEEYETLRALHAQEGSAQTRQRVDDVAYALCVATGTLDVDTAWAVARGQILTGTDELTISSP